MIYSLYQLTMEENPQEDSVISVNIPETPETPTQTPLLVVWYNDMYYTLHQYREHKDAKKRFYVEEAGQKIERRGSRGIGGLWMCLQRIQARGSFLLDGLGVFINNDCGQIQGPKFLFLKI